MLGLSLLDYEFYVSSAYGQEQGLKILYGVWDHFGEDSQAYEVAWDHYLNYTANLSLPVIYIEGPGEKLFRNEELIASSRSDDITNFTISDGDGTLRFSIMYSTKKQDRITSILSITRTCFISLILVAGSLVFAYDAQTLVLLPIERMIEKVTILARDPISASDQDQSYMGILSKATNIEEEKIEAETESWLKRLCCGKKDKDEYYETKIIENAIQKIGALLALGFGDAGKKFIQKSMEHEGGGVALI
mmetsp:Transcript_19615/g.18694  ORF Transcript_19615/g.18694 Transcript_19615/m.18694 type:complete len:248 (+) Transcript_19615:90-833(+)